MTTITARVPRVDWSNGFGRHWNGGNAAVTHAFNAQSFLFPRGEEFFIEVAREVSRSIDLTKNPELEREIKGFVGQESVHNRQHIQYNEVLESQGFENVVDKYVLRLQEHARRNFSPVTRLAIVAAYEHYTAILGNFILSNPQVLKSAEPNLALIWGWHSAEETEHKAVCFDLYCAAGGGWLRRSLMFILATINFYLMFVWVYLSLLWRDGCLHPARILGTFAQSLKYFLGRSGVGWYFIRDGFRYLSPGFHPWNQDNRVKLQTWLIANRDQLNQALEH